MEQIKNYGAGVFGKRTGGTSGLGIGMGQSEE